MVVHGIFCEIKYRHICQFLYGNSELDFEPKKFSRPKQSLSFLCNCIKDAVQLTTYISGKNRAHTENMSAAKLI